MIIQGPTMRSIATAVTMLTVLLATPAVAVTAAERCEARKLKVAGQYIACRLRAESTALKRGVAADYGKCNAKYGSKWTSTEGSANGGCPVSGDLAAVQAMAADTADDLSATISASPPAGCSGDLQTCAAELATCGGDLLACDADLTACQAGLAERCGNGAIDPGEACDLGHLNHASCIVKGFTGGQIACTAGCAFDTSACTGTRFIDNADGTISDMVSGLMWEKKLANDPLLGWAYRCEKPNHMVVIGAFCQSSPEAQTACFAGAGDQARSCGNCSEGGCYPGPSSVWQQLVDANAANFRGYSDWRLATVAELASILDRTNGPPLTNVAFHGSNCGGACTNLADPTCSCTSGWEYWSADLGSDHNQPLVMSFVSGNVFATYPHPLAFGIGLGQYRFVRGGD